MLEDGLLENFPIDRIFALHNFPLSPAGYISVKKGCVLAGMDSFEIEIKGIAGHASIPEKCLNPIAAASKLQIELENQVQLLLREYPMSSLSFTKINSTVSESINIIPGKVYLNGITRFISYEAQQALKEIIKNGIDLIATETGIEINILYQHTCPLTENGEEPTNQLINSVKKELGEEKLKLLETPLAAFDDFAYFLKKIPGCYFFIGNGESSEMVHTASYDFNDEIILPAAKLFVRLVLGYRKD